MRPSKPLAWRKRAIKFLSNETQPLVIADGDRRFIRVSQDELSKKFSNWSRTRKFLVCDVPCQPAAQGV